MKIILSAMLLLLASFSYAANIDPNDDWNVYSESDPAGWDDMWNVYSEPTYENDVWNCCPDATGDKVKPNND